MLSEIRELRVQPPTLRHGRIISVQLHRIIIRASPDRRGLVVAR